MYKVILADDDESFRQNLIRMIDWKTCGLTVAGEAENGLEALALIGSAGADIVICDIKMPGMNGLEVLSRCDTVHTKFILLSGYGDFQFARDAIRHNAFDYALKPVNAEEFSGILMRAVEALNAARSDYMANMKVNLGIRKLMVDKYESLLVHLVEAHDYAGICEYVDGFFAEPAVSQVQDGPESAYMEFAALMDKVCHTFKIDGPHAEKGVGITAKEIASLDYSKSLVKRKFKQIVSAVVTKKSSECKKIADEVAEYIREHYGEKITLESVAKRYFVNPSYFSQVFKARTGDSFSSYLIRVRLNKAKELLLLNKFRIYQIAELVGYDSENHFCHMFKKHFGVSPGDFTKTSQAPGGGAE